MTVRCNTCGTRRATFSSLLRHKAASGHGKNCNCGGYHFPHRPGSACCDAAPYPTLRRAQRAGATGDDLTDAFLDDALFGRNHKPTTQKEAPF